jgi:hypothetical protein
MSQVKVRRFGAILMLQGRFQRGYRGRVGGKSGKGKELGVVFAGFAFVDHRDIFEGERKILTIRQ